MEQTPAKVATIDQYLTAFPTEVQQLLAELRATIREAAPEAVEKISYGIPTYDYNGNLVHFAAFRHHIGLYPGPSGIEAFQDELRPYKQAKGSVQFPLGEPLPLDLVARIVRFRVQENAAKGRKARPKARGDRN